MTASASAALRCSQVSRSWLQAIRVTGTCELLDTTLAEFQDCSLDFLCGVLRHSIQSLHSCGLQVNLRFMLLLLWRATPPPTPLPFPSLTLHLQFLDQRRGIGTLGPLDAPVHHLCAPHYETPAA